MAIADSENDVADGEKRLAEYINEFYLIPIGSFALDCMRDNEQVLDALLIFHECKILL